MMLDKVQSLFPESVEFFNSQYLRRAPFASPGRASQWCHLIDWKVIEDILNSGHDDCWLPRQGRLPQQKELNQGILTPMQVTKGLNEQRTLLIRHAEKAHPVLAEIGNCFYELYQSPIDIQVYCTPPGQEGFGWHYDVEEVFVIQLSGSKEFYLRQNALNPIPKDFKKTKTNDVSQFFAGPEIRCYLAEGDWLYIPSGFWHKAKAKTHSLHLSVGVLCQQGLLRNQTGS